MMAVRRSHLGAVLLLAVLLSLAASGAPAPRTEKPLLGVEFSDNQRFGIVILGQKDPDNPSKLKRLTFKENGGSNNTCIRIDGADFLFGNSPPGRWIERVRKLADKNRIGWESVMSFPSENIRVTQQVEVVRGEQSGLRDTVLIAYTLENLSRVPHKVGLRVMLNTYIGANDGVPFIIPGQPGLLSTWQEFTEKRIPDFVEALEKPDLNRPGTVAHLGLKGVSLPGVRPEPIQSLLLCAWPGSEQRYDVDKEDRVSIKARKDSAAFLYWPERVTRPGEKRHMAFTYGLGRVTVDARDRNARLGLTVGGSFQNGGTFTVTAYVKAPKAGQKVQCTLPNGLTLVPGEKVDKVVAGGETLNQVSWRVRATRPGTYILKARSEEAMARIQVHIRAADRARD